LAAATPGTGVSAATAQSAMRACRLSARLAQLSQSGENHQHAGAPDAGGIRVGKHAQVPGEDVVGFEVG
jgi:hypothetical protein